jgi:hypothetical protein
MTPPQAPGGPFTVEYYYKARWGLADEFLALLRKNHWPLLQKQLESGRLLAVTVARPRYHATEEGRWDYRVTLVFKDVAAAHDASALGGPAAPGSGPAAHPVDLGPHAASGG